MSKERITEYQITEWEGVKIRVTISHPKLHNTISSQMILGRHMMDVIRYIHPPKDHEFFSMPEKVFEYHQWKVLNKRAYDLVDMVANNIANSLLRVLEEEVTK